MTLEQTLRNALSEGAHHVTLARGDGKSAQVIVEIEHGRVFVICEERAYCPNGPKAFSVRRWKGDEGEWVTHHVPGTVRYDQLRAVWAAEPTRVKMPA